MQGGDSDHNSDWDEAAYADSSLWKEVLLDRRRGASHGDGDGSAHADVGHGRVTLLTGVLSQRVGDPGTSALCFAVKMRDAFEQGLKEYWSNQGGNVKGYEDDIIQNDFQLAMILHVSDRYANLR